MAGETTDTKVGPLVVGFDGREESEKALDWAIAEATERRLRVVALVVAQIPIDTVNALDPSPVGFGTFPVVTPEGPPEIRPILEHARQKLADAGVDASVTWSYGSPADEILRLADEEDASAIVVGTHHHSAIARLLGGDVATTVVRAAHRDVVVAR
jgi:nucleotide-binding universal stress UspA family protein